MDPRRVAVFVGSLRRESLSRKVATALAQLSAATMRFDLIELGALPLYNADAEEDPPSAWLELRARVKAAEAALFVTPEYNRSIPGVLKNAIDIGSRPYGKSAWAHKPAAVVSLSTGAMGGFGANHHLRQCLVFLDMPTLQQPEVYLGRADTLFDEEGRLTNPQARALLDKLGCDFARWIDRTAR